MNNLPTKLRDKQDTQRRNTVNTVLNAIAELSAEGYSIKIKDLIERTGLSRSVFAKPHIRELLVINGIVKVESPNDNSAVVPQNEASRISNLQAKLRHTDDRISILTHENESLRNECALLRGRLFLLMQHIDTVKTQ